MAFGIYLDSMIHHKEEQNHLETATIQLHKKDLRNSTIFFFITHLEFKTFTWDETFWRARITLKAWRTIVNSQTSQQSPYDFLWFQDHQFGISFGEVGHPQPDDGLRECYIARWCSMSSSLECNWLASCFTEEAWIIFELWAGFWVGIGKRQN